MPAPRLIIGDLASIEGALAQAISSARTDDPLAPVTVLVGHVLLRPYLPRALAQRGLAQINVRYLLPHDLAEELSRGRLPAGRARLTPDAERLLVRDVCGEAGGYFAEIAGREGFVRALRRVFRDLESGGFTAQSFAAAAAALPPNSKFDELVRLYKLYEECRAGFAAPADHYRAADTAAFEGPLFVYGVWSQSMPELLAQMIEGIAADHDVTVFLPSSGLDADVAHVALRTRLFPTADVPPLPPADLPGPPQLASSLFRDEPIPSAATGVSLVSAADTVREVWEAARACLQWAREGIRFHEMAVVYKSGDTYLPLIDEIFSEARIETYLHAGRLLAGHPLGRRVLSLLDLAGDPAFPRAKVMEFLTETQLPRDTVRAQGNPSPSEWETMTRDAGIVEGAPQWDERLRRLATEKRAGAQQEGRAFLADHADRIERFADFAAQLAAALAAHPADATWADHLRYLRGLAETYADGVAPIIEALDDLRVLEAVREPVTFDAFSRAVRDYLEARDASDVLNEPIRRFGRRGVAVLDATSLRHLRFRAVYTLGVAERAWPSPPRPDPLLLERERRQLNAAGLGVLPMKTEPDEEALTFWLAAQSATEQLRISYARAEAGGSGKHLPSYFFRAAVEALEGRKLKFGDLEDNAFVRRFAAGRLAADEAGAAVSPAEYDRTLVHDYLMERAGAANVRALEEHRPAFGRALAARHARWSRALTEYDGCMTAPDATAAVRDRSPFAREETVSASRLETYATCPYRYFLRYVLRIDPLEEPEAIDRLHPLERGTMIHAILERFMREICPDDPPRPEARERHIERLLALAHEEGAERERRGLTGKKLIWEIDRRQIHEDLVRWYGKEADGYGSGLTPRGFEVGFGPQWYGRTGPEDPLSSSDPLLLSAGGREISLQGRIDRIDWDEDRTRYRVIDYKSGKSKTKVTLDGGKALQLPLYLQAAAQLLGIPIDQGEAQYFYVSTAGEFKRPQISGADLAARATDVDQVLTTIAGGVDAGFFAPNPGVDAYNCKYCDYKDVCDARIAPLMKRKGEDARGAAFIAMAEIT